MTSKLDKNCKVLIEVYARMEERGLKYHHSAYARGYISRKGGAGYEDYLGRFGKGVKVHRPCWESTNYHYVDYWIEG